MPTYEYECKSCGHNFEIFQSMSDQPLKICPECGREIRRLIFGGTGVIFKGSGFYVTDKNKSDKTKSEKRKTSSAAEPCAQCPAGETGKCPAASAEHPETKSA
ncbi:MAG: FmdB family transcriptional regulator [Treponema sp.]|jgi:putative FmdB family regulatory protein|nr:FmdB family transcriptional regulator [Treponema sp.]